MLSLKGSLNSAASAAMILLTSIHEKLAMARSIAMTGSYTAALSSFDCVIDEVQR